jgi:RND superfamily putative drug exporter
MDPMSIIGVFTVVFGISVTYATLLLMRTRDAYVTAGSAGGPVAVALRDTAAPATGAGLVMIAALIPFATTDLLNVRAFGIGVAVAILLDTVVVRPVLLPAAISVLGRVGWWPTSPSAPPGPSAPSGQTQSRGPARTSLPAAAPSAPAPTTPIGAAR